MTFGRNYQEQRERREAEKASNLRALVTTPAYRLGTYSGSTSGAAVEKENPLRSESYRRLVAAMPCWFCGIEGYTQAAHADQGKGMGLKTDDRTCYPLCIGCHAVIGSSGTFTREERRAMEMEAGIETRAAILAAGDWPKNLPIFNEKENEL